jgi:hypothetical protein
VCRFRAAQLDLGGGFPHEDEFTRDRVLGDHAPMLDCWTVGLKSRKGCEEPACYGGPRRDVGICALWCSRRRKVRDPAGTSRRHVRNQKKPHSSEGWCDKKLDWVHDARPSLRLSRFKLHTGARQCSANIRPVTTPTREKVKRHPLGVDWGVDCWPEY